MHKTISNQKKGTIIDENTFKIAPSELLSNNFYYVPLRLNQVKCWALIDPACNFSIVSIRLANYLNLSIKKGSANETIKLGEKGTAVKRIGETQNKVNLFYNNISKDAKLEIMNIRDEVDVLLGTDLLHELNITMHGLVMDWDSNEHHILPPLIDPNPNPPNNSPYGNEAEMKTVKDKIQPYINANVAIDPASHCTLPNSEVSIPVKEDYVEGYRAQYPIDDAYQHIVDEQIQTWLTNRVIERSPPNTAYNSPIFIIKRKNPIAGEYDGKKTRAILDI
jgi:hypothetical protein